MKSDYKIFCLFLFILMFCLPAAMAQKKTAYATRITAPPDIDGVLTDACWRLCDSADSFRQYVPVYDVNPTQRTVVRIAYNDEAIFVGAMMYDNAPDSILTEFGVRDDELNADRFAIQFDTYHMQTDAYTFAVWASGTQADWRHTDETYNAVWQSAVKINDKGLACEMKISYSALRFPKTAVQEWGLQIFRGIRRHRETDQWALEVKSNANFLTDWGKLEGIRDVKPALRLSLTPFVSLYGDHYPYNEKGKSNFSYSFSGGLDLKYGINESFTLDITLLPDFSQVQSDYPVKNISAQETVYEEYRPFFTEAIDLFKEGDLFYTRRIGRTPAGYQSVYDSLGNGEVIKKNPGQAKLLNAIKFSGRGKKGTAVGVFNAITNNMYARIEDSLGNTSKILTEPLTNYNILVLDQILKNNSKIYLVNTNVLRDKKYDDANVTLLGVTLNDKKNRYQFAGFAAMSNKLHKADTGSRKITSTPGYQYSLSFAKVSGKFQFSIYRKEMNHKWDANDIGLTLQNNRSTTGATIGYKIFEPFWILRDMAHSIEIYHIENFLAKRVEDFRITYSGNATTRKYLTIWGSFILSPLKVNNFQDTRSPGRYFVMDRWFYASLNGSSDYRKTFALDVNLEYWQEIYGDGVSYGVTLNPIIKPSDKFTFNIKSIYNGNYNDIGFVYNDTIGNIIMGKRDIIIVQNQFEGRYMFRNNLALSLLVRHYWSKGIYDKHYKLDYDGILITDPLLPLDKDYNFNFNAFNIDLMFYWEFAPGSSLNITYKNNILKEGSQIVPSYFKNFGNIFAEKQLNSLSLKVLYYIDYQQLKSFAHQRKTRKTRHD